MSDFKEMVKEDIKDVFLDLEMFGEQHVVAGKEMVIVLDDTESRNRNEQYQDGKAIYNKRILFYVAAEDLGSLPPLGMEIDVDGRGYKVLQAEQENGIYSIVAEEFRDNGCY